MHRGSILSHPFRNWNFFLFPEDEADDEIPDFGAQHAKRQVAGIPEEGHLEDVQDVHIGDAVYPLRVASEIPQFPEETAKEGGQRGGDGGAPVAGPDSGKGVRLPPESGSSRVDKTAGRW